MATVNLTPDGDGFYTGYAASGCVNEWECVDDPPGAPDDDATRLQLGASVSGRSSVTFTDYTSGGTINSVTIHIRYRKGLGNSATIRIIIRISGTDYESGDITVPGDGAYANYSNVWATNPATATSWTDSDLDALEAGVRAITTGDAQNRWTQIYAVVDYTPVSSITIVEAPPASLFIAPASYELWLTSDTGARIAELSTFLSLECNRVVNGIGSFAMEMPLSFDPNLLIPDRMVQVWRQPSGGRLGLWRVYFLRRWRFSTAESRQVVSLSGPDINDLLRRRIVAAYTGSSQETKTDFADDMMKAVVSEALSNAAAPVPTAGTRAWPNLTVAGDLGLGPTITKSFAWDKLLTSSNAGVLSQLAEAAREAGTEVFFDVVPNAVGMGTITFSFRTYTDQPGQDVSSQVIFDQAAGNMQDPSLEYDYTEEENYIYALGQGEEADRNVQQVSDSARYGASIWARCEASTDARNQDTDNSVREAGRAALSEGRPRIRFTATPVDTAGTRFGIDWDFGYRVGARYQNRAFTAIIRAAAILVSDQGEEIQARLDFEDFL